MSVLKDPPRKSTPRLHNRPCNILLKQDIHQTVHPKIKVGCPALRRYKAGPSPPPVCGSTAILCSVISKEVNLTSYGGTDLLPKGQRTIKKWMGDQLVLPLLQDSSDPYPSTSSHWPFILPFPSSSWPSS
ncbi:unnamed protein product [Nezara viridula]|uniref:Uncharacterized protein n=1 Tax=Nezara viridula TaxID=85310 RepID=A0A9P0E7D6_NEZVI|nr:unnamed protein product [Nezara viridula]